MARPGPGLHFVLPRLPCGDRASPPGSRRTTDFTDLFAVLRRPIRLLTAYRRWVPAARGESAAAQHLEVLRHA